jgi:hypothetical protein
MRPRGLHAVSGFACWLLCLQELTDPQTGLPKQEKPAKINESSSTTKNKKKRYYNNKKKGTAVYSQSQALDETAILAGQEDPFVDLEHQ